MTIKRGSFAIAPIVLLPASLVAQDSAPMPATPPAATHGFTERVIHLVNLGPEIDGMTGRKLRMRLITIAPGGASARHDHVGRPGTVYMLQGEAIDHRNGVATEYGPGTGWPEDRRTIHWLENRGPEPVVEISVDIVKTP